MDTLDQMIADEMQSLANLAERYAAQKIKVDALLAASAARPAVTQVVPPKPSGNSGGKPKGAISKAWRTVLEQAYQWDRRFSYQDIQTLYGLEYDKSPEMPSIRDRIRNFIEWGFVEGTPESGFTVTENAASKFSFSKPTEASEGNGPHGSDASEPSAQGWGVSPPQPSILSNPQSGPAS